MKIATRDMLCSRIRMDVHSVGAVRQPARGVPPPIFKFQGPYLLGASNPRLRAAATASRREAAPSRAMMADT
jgi:hypothetical protein